ncbi:unnamed protein product [Caenorhabditis auriculariae]|uniref:Uncharacterized protein n=1 Tax=Caenorhabditis auriculariae TaxID=2777116 RepID=A0A8S1GR09_9PELO|nr:unnamed protein product [Caenorhabditis auriculariae]
MALRKRWLGSIDLSETNFWAAFFHLLSASVAIASLLSNEWILIDEDAAAANTTEPEKTQLLYEISATADKCRSIGCRDFWKPAQFGGFVDQLGRPHTAFRYDGKVVLDCITPIVANLFYILIALCFVICLTSTLCCVMNVLPPTHGFLHWLRTNTILEMSNMMLTFCACVTAIVAHTEVSALRPDAEVTIGSGVFFNCLAGLLSFLAAMAGIRHTTKLNRMRRIDNQRLLCARSLRSWRDAARRPDDTRPIVDFERYLDECSSTEMTETSSDAPSQVVENI